MPTRTYRIPNTLFSDQTNYGNMDFESQRIKEEEQRRAESTRKFVTHCNYSYESVI
jgi:hypothetical protein